MILQRASNRRLVKLSRKVFAREISSPKEPTWFQRSKWAPRSGQTWGRHSVLSPKFLSADYADYTDDCRCRQGAGVDRAIIQKSKTRIPHQNNLCNRRNLRFSSFVRYLSLMISHLGWLFPTTAPEMRHR